MSVCVISFSARKNGNCSQISKYVSSLFSDVKQYDFSKLKVKPCGNCNYQCFHNIKKCPFVKDKEKEMLDAIMESEMTFFIVPNYCDYPCSNYFIFNERSVCYFQHNEKLLYQYLDVEKKFIVVSNTSKENFYKAFTYQTTDEPQILFLPTKQYGKNSIEGNLFESEQAMEDLKKFVLE